MMAGAEAGAKESNYLHLQPPRQSWNLLTLLYDKLQRGEPCWIFAPCESTILSLEMKLWQKHGAVSCALIKHSGFIVAPSSPLFSKKPREGAAAKRQPSCQLDRRSQCISATRQRQPSSSQAGGGGSSWDFLRVESAPERNLGQSRSYRSCSLFYCVCMRRWVQPVRSFQWGWERTQSNFCLLAWRPGLFKPLASLPSFFPSFSFPPTLPVFPFPEFIWIP